MHLRHFPAHEVGTLLGVSTPAVWRWVGQYNRQGPAGLARHGRGGRRWGFLTLDQERELLAALQEEAGRGRVLTAKQIYGRVRQAVGKKVSLDYVYRLLHRHGWPAEHVWEYLRENHFGNDTLPSLEAVGERLGDRPPRPGRAARSGPLPDVLRLAQYYTFVVKLV
jgi:transposase